MSPELKKLTSPTALERGRPMVDRRLRQDENIVWSCEPAQHLLLLDLVYRAALWWTIFPCIVPMTADVLFLCALIMAAFAYLEFRQRQNGSFYVLTNERAFLGVFKRNGDLRLHDYDLANLTAVSKSPFTRTIKLKFKESGGKKTIRFPYVNNPKVAVDLLLPSCHSRI